MLFVIMTFRCFRWSGLYFSFCPCILQATTVNSLCLSEYIAFSPLALLHVVPFSSVFTVYLLLFLWIYYCHPNPAAAAAKSLQSCLTLCDPIDGSPPGSPVLRILQARASGVGCHFLLQWIFPTQRLNPHLQYCRQSPALQADSLLTEPPGMKSHGQRSLVGYSPWGHKSRTWLSD